MSVMTVLLLVVMWLVTGMGCGSSSQDKATPAAKPGSSPSAPTSASAAGRQPLFVVAGVDITGSVDQYADKALAVYRSLVLRSRPEDELWFRTITEASYQASNHIVRKPALRMPTVTNQFDPRQKRARRLAMSRVVAVQRKVADQLTQLSFEPSPQTDIVGFLAAAGDLLKNAPSGAKKVVMMATDLIDTRGFQGRPQLDGVEVIVLEYVVERDPDVIQKRREAWRQRFEEWGAANIEFRLAH